MLDLDDLPRMLCTFSPHLGKPELINEVFVNLGARILDGATFFHYQRFLEIDLLDPWLEIHAYKIELIINFLAKIIDAFHGDTRYRDEVFTGKQISRKQPFFFL